MGDVIQTVVAFIIVLSILVFVHELGHFLFAKRAGILVREFAIGFGPKIFSRRRGETVYSIRMLPLGGYVRMAGEDPEFVDVKTGSLIYASQNAEGKLDHIYLQEPKQSKDNLITGRLLEMDLEKKLYIVLVDENDPDKDHHYQLDEKAFIHLDHKDEIQIAPEDRKFGSKTTGQKAMTILAGPVFNLIFTVILFIVFTFMTGIETRLPVQETLQGSPAAKAGLKQGDVIIAVDDKRVNTLDMLRVELINSKGKELDFTIKRDGKLIHVPLKPMKKGEAYIMGVVFDMRKMTRPATIPEAVSEGFTKTYQWSVVILDGFAKLVTGQISVDKLGGPVQMGDITGQAAEAGIIALIKWTALLSLNLAIFNLLPIPALDGSRLVFIGLEAVRGRPLNPNKENLVHLVGLAMLMTLMLVVTYNDIVKIFFT